MTSITLGSCTLIHGDCLQEMPDLPEKSVDLILCDLPYGTTQNKWDSVIPLEPLWAQYKRVAKGAIVLNAAQPFTSILVCSNLPMFKYEWVWRKTQAVGHLNAWKQPMRQHESVLVFCDGSTIYNPEITDKLEEHIRPLSPRTKGTSNYGVHGLTERRCPPDKSMPRSVLDFPNSQGGIHPTQKPVPLMEYLIRTYTNEGETVLDNCFGSGTTAIACIRTGRKFIGHEQDEGYFNTAVERVRKELEQGQLL